MRMRSYVMPARFPAAADIPALNQARLWTSRFRATCWRVPIGAWISRRARQNYAEAVTITRICKIKTMVTATSEAIKSIRHGGSFCPFSRGNVELSTRVVVIKMKNVTETANV